MIIEISNINWEHIVRYLDLQTALLLHLLNSASSCQVLNSRRKLSPAFVLLIFLISCVWWVHIKNTNTYRKYLWAVLGFYQSEGDTSDFRDATGTLFRTSSILKSRLRSPLPLHRPQLLVAVPNNMSPWQYYGHAPGVALLWKPAEPVTCQTPWKTNLLTALLCGGFWWLMTPL